MVRPIEFEGGLRTTSVTIPNELLAAARDSRINISCILRSALGDALRDPEIADKHKHKNKLDKLLEIAPRIIQQQAMRVAANPKDLWAAAVYISKFTGMQVAPGELRRFFEQLTNKTGDPS